jgi:glycolate oxidase iron-sulfur subunit
MADSRLKRKLDNIQATGADVVVTNGPGCLLQLKAAVQTNNLNVQVKHISELVEEAMGEE